MTEPKRPDIGPQVPWGEILIPIIVTYAFEHGYLNDARWQNQRTP